MDRAGMWQEFMAAGVVSGAFLEVDGEDYDRLQAKWFGRGLGNLVHAALKPVAKVVDRVTGTDLANCGGCAERRMKLNTMGL